jgi:hypothetical protein
MAKKKNKGKGGDQTRAIMVLFDGLTHGGKIYREGDIETKPTPHLIELAENRTRYYHRDKKKKITCCKFVPMPTAGSNGDGKKLELEDIEKLTDFDIIRALVKEHGFSRKAAASFTRERLEDYLYRLQA